jgi:hypothetical protein
VAEFGTPQGYRVSTEFHTGGGTILDVAIDGPATSSRTSPG